jgi:hypothetical protein
MAGDTPGSHGNHNNHHGDSSTQSFRRAEIHVGPGLYVKRPLLLPDFNQNWNCRQNVAKLPNIKFYANLFSLSVVVTCVQADGLTAERAKSSAGFANKVKLESLRQTVVVQRLALLLCLQEFLGFVSSRRLPVLAELFNRFLPFLQLKIGIVP